MNTKNTWHTTCNEGISVSWLCAGLHDFDSILIKALVLSRGWTCLCGAIEHEGGKILVRNEMPVNKTLLTQFIFIAGA